MGGETPVRARWDTTFRSLRVRNYRLFASGQAVSLIGTWMQMIAQDWLTLELTDNSPTALGYVTALQFVPMLLLALYGGKLADHFDKRYLLMAANAVFALLSVGLGALVVSGSAHIWHVYVFALCLGLVASVETPTRQAFASELVGTSLLPNALSLSAATFNTARIIGPAIGGLAITAFGIGPVFLINAVTYLGPLVAQYRMRPSEMYREGLRGRGDRSAIRVRDGLSYVWG